jgi:hypothetical protein
MIIERLGCSESTGHFSELRAAALPGHRPNSRSPVAGARGAAIPLATFPASRQPAKALVPPAENSRKQTLTATLIRVVKADCLERPPPANVIGVKNRLKR